MRALARVVILAVLVQGIAGCICGQARFVRIDGPEELRVVERSWSSQDYDFIVWPLPTRYELVRSGYRIEAEVRVLHDRLPALWLRATDATGNDLSVWDPEQPYLRPQPLNMSAPYRYLEEGSWSFDVKRGDEVIGRETIHYELRSRLFGCGWNVEF